MTTSITLIQSKKPHQVCKTYATDSDGTLHKDVVANVTEGVAKTVQANTAEDMAAILRTVTKRADLVICPGVWANSQGVEKFQIFSEAKLCEIVGSKVGEVAGGVINHNGNPISARLKRGIAPSVWVLIDADDPAGMPAEWLGLPIGTRLEMLEPVIKGISKCERIELRGSSNRVRKEGEEPKQASHAWIQVDNAGMIETMREVAKVLFDEPLSNLDAKLRAHMRYEIARLHKELRTTSVYVTHDQMEAMTLADRIVLLNAGKIEQVGTPQEIYQQPQSLFVAGFIGTPTMNLLEMTVAKTGESWVLSGEGCTFPIVGDGFSLHDGQKVVLGFRPSKLKISDTTSGADVIASGVVDMVEFHGDEILLGIDHGRGRVTAFVDAFQAPIEGAQVGFSLDEQDMHLFDCETEQSLRKM